jgi:iron complex transport system ATP-binding protein
LIEQPFAQLSQGQQQRALLARSLIRRPALLLLDEPCAGLDLAGSEKYLNLIRRLAQTPGGPTLIMVTHRVSEIVAGFTHALLLHQGRVLASGSLDKVLTDTLLSQTLETPVRVSRQSGRWTAVPESPENEAAETIAWG